MKERADIEQEGPKPAVTQFMKLAVTVFVIACYFFLLLKTLVL